MLRCTVASQFTMNYHRWRLRQTSPQLAEMLFGCFFIVPTLHGKIQNISLLLRDLPAIGASPSMVSRTSPGATGRPS